MRLSERAKTHKGTAWCRLHSHTLHLNLVVGILFQFEAGIIGYASDRVENGRGVVALVRAKPVSRHRKADCRDHLSPGAVDRSAHATQSDQNLLVIVGVPPLSH